MPDGSEMVADMPGRGATPREVASATVRVLRAHKCLDADFFAVLREERPRRRTEVDRLEREWREWNEAAAAKSADDTTAAPARYRMGKNETNGMLRLLEAQGRALEDALKLVERDGVFDPKAEEVLARLKVALVNWNQELLEVRGWNHACPASDGPV